MDQELYPDEGLILRPWSFKDAGALRELIVANESHLAAWLPWAHERTSKKGVEDFIHNSRFSTLGSGNGFYGIWENGVLVGEIARISTSKRNRFCSMSYWLAASAQGRGIVIRSAKCLLAHNFRNLDMNRVEIRVATGNDKSIAVVEKLGFLREGLLRQAELIQDDFMDHEVFSMLRDEWKALYG
jgi:ribosomal-protein-serine acetyltransferase